jgi:hypothetical protein
MVRRKVGEREKQLSEQEIGDLLDADGVSYVVAQNDFWTDPAVMTRFHSLLHSRHFQEVAHIPVVTNVPTESQTLLICRNLGNIGHGPHIVDLQLPFIGNRVAGAVRR